MTNPINNFMSDTIEMFKLIIVGILMIIILGALGTAVAMTEFTNQFILMIGWIIFFIMAIPPIGVIIGIIVWAIKEFQPTTSFP